MRTVIFPLLILLLLPRGANAQETEFKASLFKENKEAFRLAEESLKKGMALTDKAMDLETQGGKAAKVWQEALPYLLEAQLFNPKYSRLNYMIARTMEGCDRMGEAASYARQAWALDPEVETYNYFLLARAAHLRLATDSALQFLSMYETKAKSRELESMTTRIRKLRTEIDHARNMTGKPRERVWIENVAGLNSPADELVPNLPADAAFMLFNRSEGEGEASTLMMAERLPGGWGEPEEWLGGQFSGYRVIAISQDGQELFLSSRTTGSYDIYYSELQGIQWSDPRKMPDYKINTEAEETHASFYFDRIKFYFVSDNDYANKGGKDIFFSGRINTSIREEWGKAHPMGSELNTPYDEGSVFMHPDGKTVYFASKGHNSMGGYDIFRSERLPGRWADPENLGYPINSPYDEIFFTIGPSGKHAYVCSNRDGGKGGFDIYRVTFLGPPKPNMVDYRDHLLSSMAEPTVQRSLEAAKEVDNVHLTILKGMVLDAFTSKPVEASIEITDNQKNELIAVFRSNSATGKFLVSLPAGKNYGIAVAAPNYLFHSENFDLPENSEYQIVEKEVRLKNACIGCSIVLNNIFFDIGKHTLRPESTSELNRLAQLLKDIQKVKPATKVEISGHTDNTGSEATNLTLSGNRAKAVVDYLITQGIPATMLTSKGYGSGQPVASNATSAGRQQNRRTEFKIIE